jgi:hypothetical protein
VISLSTARTQGMAWMADESDEFVSLLTHRDDHPGYSGDWLGEAPMSLGEARLLLDRRLLEHAPESLRADLEWLRDWR